jgi:two-component system copper resistance phosphate regulon response regulator CusR
MEKKKVLIVEDNPQQQTALYDAVAKAGFLVRRASTGDEGYHLAISSEPDLIIVDKMMPNTNGLMMANMIRSKNDWGKHVPMLFLSNVASTSEEERGMLEAIRPQEYLSKSETSLEMLAQKIKAALSASNSDA